LPFGAKFKAINTSKITLLWGLFDDMTFFEFTLKRAKSISTFLSIISLVDTNLIVEGTFMKKTPKMGLLAGL